MSMSMRVVGFRPADDTFRRMKAAWDACKAAGVMPPKEVTAFFNGDEPDDAGVEVPLRRVAGVSEYKADMREGFEVDLRLLDPTIKIIRFYCSW